MDIFPLADLNDAHRQLGERYLEFFKSDTLSLGLYALPAGDEDPQQPHTEDEIYYVISGAARLMVGGDDRAIGPGDVVFVRAGDVHRFHGISEALTLLVVFAPPRGSQARA